MGFNFFIVAESWGLFRGNKGSVYFLTIKMCRPRCVHVLFTRTFIRDLGVNCLRPERLAYSMRRLPVLFILDLHGHLLEMAFKEDYVCQ